ncbi:hypothetical protein FKM82_021494 [Ascaphus truei]
MTPQGSSSDPHSTCGSKMKAGGVRRARETREQHVQNPSMLRTSGPGLCSLTVPLCARSSADTLRSDVTAVVVPHQLSSCGERGGGGGKERREGEM